eukprot:2629974-Amphidinium_carterae.1
MRQQMEIQNSSQVTTAEFLQCTPDSSSSSVALRPRNQDVPKQLDLQTYWKATSTQGFAQRIEGCRDKLQPAAEAHHAAYDASIEAHATPVRESDVVEFKTLKSMFCVVVNFIDKVHISADSDSGTECALDARPLSRLGPRHTRPQLCAPSDTPTYVAAERS